MWYSQPHYSCRKTCGCIAVAIGVIRPIINLYQLRLAHIIILSTLRIALYINYFIYTISLWYQLYNYQLFNAQNGSPININLIIFKQTPNDMQIFFLLFSDWSTERLWVQFKDSLLFSSKYLLKFVNLLGFEWLA